MDRVSGKLTLKHEHSLPAQPWQLCISPDQRFLYQQVRGDGYSGVFSNRIDPETGGVTQVGEVELEADARCVATDKTGRLLLAAYLFPGKVTVHPIGAAYGPQLNNSLKEIRGQC